MEKKYPKMEVIFQDLMDMCKEDFYSLSKLKIIELYFKSRKSIPKCIMSYKEYVDSNPAIYLHFKPSRIEKIVNLYICENNAGYVQPIGKRKFLKKFLEQYPSPKFVHFAENEWTVEMLEEFIRLKYECTITKDTIRKELKKMYDTYGNRFIQEIEKKYTIYFAQKINDSEMNNEKIYCYQFWELAYPFRTSVKYTDNNRTSSYIGCIFDTTNSMFDTNYKAVPYFQISENFKTHILNLEYYFNIPMQQGTVILKKNDSTAKLVKDYYYYCFEQKKTIPTFQLYFLPCAELITEDFEDSEYIARYNAVYQKINFEIMLPFSRNGLSCFERLKKFSEEDELDDFLMDFFSYKRVKLDSRYKFNRLPKVLSKKEKQPHTP